MDWKTFYRDELLSPEGQEHIEGCFERLADSVLVVIDPGHGGKDP